MAVSILECLNNARYNLIDNKGVGIAFAIGKEQLDNAIHLLEKGYDPEDEVEPLIEKFGSIQRVPLKHADIS